MLATGNEASRGGHNGRKPQRRQQFFVLLTSTNKTYPGCKACNAVRQTSTGHEKNIQNSLSATETRRRFTDRRSMHLLPRRQILKGHDAEI